MRNNFWSRKKHQLEQCKRNQPRYLSFLFKLGRFGLAFSCLVTLILPMLQNVMHQVLTPNEMSAYFTYVTFGMLLSFISLVFLYIVPLPMRKWEKDLRLAQVCACIGLAAIAAGMFSVNSWVTPVGISTTLIIVILTYLAMRPENHRKTHS